MFFCSGPFWQNMDRKTGRARKKRISPGFVYNHIDAGLSPASKADRSGHFWAARSIFKGRAFPRMERSFREKCPPGYFAGGAPFMTVFPVTRSPRGR